jgi:hypothetical protein
MDIKRRLFQSLKPCCVQLSETVTNVGSGRSPASELIPDLQQLLLKLGGITQVDAKHIDAKIADYLFYPLSLIFREREKVPFRVLELALCCLRYILETGWRDIHSPQLATQLLILLTFLAAQRQIGKRKDVAPEEVQTVALNCIGLLCRAVGKSSTCRNALLAAENIPALGHTITVIIENCKAGSSVDLQLAALDTLTAFREAVPDRDVFASFLPGIVSALSHILTTSTKARRNYQVYVKGIIVLRQVITLVLSDTQIDVARSHSTSVSDSVSKIPSDETWLGATEGQLKIALISVLKLRTHGRDEVRLALVELCRALLVDCARSLPACSQMALETLVMLSRDNEDETEGCSVVYLLETNPSIAELLRSSLYDWVVALPRVMSSNDETAKSSIIYRIKTSYTMLGKSELDLSIIENMMMTAMSDSLSQAISGSQISHPYFGATALARASTILSTYGSDQLGTKTFAQVLVKHDIAVDLLSGFRSLIQAMSSSRNTKMLIMEGLENARFGQGGQRIANLYISLEALKEKTSQESEFDELLDLGLVTDQDAIVYEELYGYALSILSDSEDNEQDWRLQALALEAVALQANRLKTSFRVELVDALYLVVHLMGSQNEGLRSHAITCLNNVAFSSGYKDARDLLISNVDYLVNAISTKLNAFDISPQAPQVMLMMVRLCGPSLLPYLDDLIDSIFEALECFHGYPVLVELLFSVLKVVVEEGVKAPQYTITQGDLVSHQKSIAGPATIDSLTASLQKRKVQASRTLEDEIEEMQDDPPRETPQRPWAELRKKTSEDVDNEFENNEDTSTPPAAPEEKSPPLTRQYTTLTRITALTQHHLPSSSSALRTSLLGLLTTSLPYLAHHDDTFLPMVHTLWPVLVSRLDDREAFVVASVLDCLGLICKGAGDFVAQRIEKLWPKIRESWQQLQMEPSTPKVIDLQRVQKDHSRQSISITKAPSLSSMSRSDLLVAPAVTSGKTSSTYSSGTRGDSSSDLLLSSSRSLSRSGSTNIGSPAGEARSTPYISTSTTTISTALSRFLVRLVSHVRISQAMFEDVLYEMLWTSLLGEARASMEDEKDEKDQSMGEEGRKKLVMEALERTNADAVWLALRGAGIGQGKMRTSIPRSVDEGVPWIVVA